MKHLNFNVISAFVFTLLIVSIYFMVGIKCKNDKETFWDVSDNPSVMCKGGPYFWDPETPEGKKCIELSKTEKGMMSITGDCPNGYNGTPLIPFEYTHS
jgi:hypothetical protein